MILKSLKTFFYNALTDYYPETEIQSFFYLLTEDILKMKRVDVALNLYTVVSGKKYAKYEKAIKQLQKFRPIQYIIGETEFYGLSFKVNEHTLIPRPETEELVAWIIKCYSERYTEHNRSANEKPFKILDIGTGSGCIAIALAKYITNVEVYALDVSEDALKVAKQNAKLNEVNVEFIQGDILETAHAELVSESQTFDVIVSNPPYVRHSEKTEINANVLEHEPHLALFVDDNNPLQFYNVICEFAKNHLSVRGALYFEINEYLGKEMLQLLNDFSFKDIILKQDLFGKDRMIKGFR